MRMVRRAIYRLATALLVWGVAPVELLAQPFEQLGVRALGMGGAFVAVADDATAIYWNPAGFATGDYFGGVVEHIEGRVDESVVRGAKGRATLVAVGMPALGLGYFRTTSVAVAGAPDVSGRGVAPTATVAVAGTRINSSNVAAALLQSLGDHLVVATTLRGTSLSVAHVEAHEGTPFSAFDAGLRGSAEFTRTVLDADVGMMGKFRNVRLGAVVRNLRAPEVQVSPVRRMELRRQARMGVAVLASDAWIVAADVDLVAGEDEVFGRKLAAGAQHVFRGRPIALRAGARFALEGPSRSWWSAGTSVPIRSGMWLDGQLTLGSSAADHSWGVSARVGF